MIPYPVTPGTTVVPGHCGSLCPRWHQCRTESPAAPSLLVTARPLQLVAAAATGHCQVIGPPVLHGPGALSTVRSQSQGPSTQCGGRNPVTAAIYKIHRGDSSHNSLSHTVPAAGPGRGFPNGSTVQPGPAGVGKLPPPGRAKLRLQSVTAAGPATVPTAPAAER
eukprot:745897-Hanusia_phi.AAC.1